MVTAHTLPLYVALSRHLDSIRRLQAVTNPPAGNLTALELHESWIDRVTREYLPSGSGFDNGTRILSASCTPGRIKFRTSFHHLSDGMYSGWTEHDVTIRPTFGGFALTVSGPNRNDIKEYIADTFHHALTVEVEA